MQLWINRSGPGGWTTWWKQTKHENPTCVLTEVHVLFLFQEWRVEKNPPQWVPQGLPFTIFQPVTKENSQIRFRSSVDWNCPELSPHAQVLSNYSHQRHAGYVDEPPGQGSWKMSVIYPAADHVEEVHGDREVQALFPSADEEPQTEGAAGTVTRKRCQSLGITVH